jgi:hypothetical protein
MNGAFRPRRLQYYAVKGTMGFHWVWIDESLLKSGGNPYIAGFNSKQAAIEYGKQNGWDVSHETKEG